MINYNLTKIKGMKLLFKHDYKILLNDLSVTVTDTG